MKIVRPRLGVSPTSTQSCCFRLIYSLALCFCAGLTQLGYSQATTSSPIFEFGFTHVNQTNADDYLVETSGVRKYSEWQNPPTTYWGPSQNNVEGALVYRFPLPQAAGSFYLKANDSSWDFNNEPGGFGRGCSALEVSRDGVNWIVLRNSLDSRQWGVDWSYEGDLPPEMIGATEVWLRLRFLCEGAPNSSYTVTQFGRSSSAAIENVFDFRAYSMLRGQPPRFNTFMLQSSQAGSTTDIDNLRVIDLDTGEVVYSNDFSNASKATDNLQLFYFPQGGANTTNFVVNGPMTRVVDGKLRLETTGFGANGGGGYESHSEAEYTQPLPHNFLVEFDAVRLQWPGHFHFHVSYRDPTDPPSSHEPSGAYTTNRATPYRLDVLRMAASGSWFQQYGLFTDAATANNSWPISFPAPPGSLQQTHKLGISLSNNIASFYLDGQLLNSADISEYLGGSGDFDNDGVNDYREGKDGTDPNDPNSFNPLSQDLIAFYTFDGNLDDESGYGRHLTQVLNVQTVGDMRSSEGQSLRLPSSSGSDARSTLSSGLTNNMPRSLSFWFYSDGPQPWPSGNIVMVGGDATSRVAIDRGEGTVQIDNGSGREARTVQIPNLHQRVHHFVWTYQDNLTNSKFYLNGRPLADGAIDNATLDGLGEYPVRIGDLNDRGFVGKIDDLRVYKRVLTAEEVEHIYILEAQKLDTDQDGLIDSVEFRLEHMGFDRYVAQSPATVQSIFSNPNLAGLYTQTEFEGNFGAGRGEGREDVISNPGSYGLYTPDSIMELNLGGLMMQKTGNQVSVSFKVQSKMNLEDPTWTDVGTYLLPPVTMPENKGFLRIRAEQ